MFLLVTLLSGLLWSWLPSTGTATGSAGSGQLVRWQDAAHDWLLVVDPETRELVVYDARDGRPLQRMGADDGLPPVQSIARQGSSLFVTGRQQQAWRRLRLPDLQTVAVSGR